MASYAEIDKIYFVPSGEDDHRREGFVEVKSSELCSGRNPVKDGVYDPRMGTSDSHITCKTCENQSKIREHGKEICPGHPGKLELRAPVENPIAIDEIRRWLKITCFTCGEPVVDWVKYGGIQQSKRLAKAASTDTAGRQCPKCKTIHPKVIKDEDDHFTFRYKEPGWQPSRKDQQPPKLYPHVIKKIFGRITSDTVYKFGKNAKTNHPAMYILSCIQIPPITIRPFVKSWGTGTGSGSASYHDTTTMVQYIVKRNGMLPEELPDEIIEKVENKKGRGLQPSPLDKSITMLNQFYYDLILGSTNTSATQGTTGKRGIVARGGSLPSILRRHPRKEGRLRQNLLGKRVLSITRSTISGNTRLKIDEVGIPQAFAQTIHVAETVQEYNRERLMTFYLNGTKYPGCSKVVRRATKRPHNIEQLRSRGTQLENGDIVYRDIITGDFAFYNRQPSLERSSIGVHRVVVFNDPEIHTFQMNVSACDNYNADFDGDQMNLWVPHEIMARVEAEIMSGISNWFISTKTSGPVNGEVQDATVGCFKLTREDVKMNKYNAMRLHEATGFDPPIFEGDNTTIYTGRDVVSMLLVNTPVNYTGTPKWFNVNYVPYIDYRPDEIKTVIRKGRLVTGVLDKTSVGAGATGGIFHLIARKYGSRKALDMIYALQQIAVDFLSIHGFTVSTGDLMVTKKGQAELREITSGLLKQSQEITNDLLNGKVIPPLNMTTHQRYEWLQKNALMFPDEVLKPVLMSMAPESNGLLTMVAIGSKGNPNNMMHIMGLIGQVTINTERIREQFGFRRTSPYFPRFAVHPGAYGFITNSYMSGMTNSQFIFSDMNGRFDLINKALSTSTTGYQMRKNIMGLQSIVVDYGRRSSKDTKIVQFLYGDDGLDARQLERVVFKSVMMSDKELKSQFWFSSKDRSSSRVIDAAFDRIKEDRDFYRHVFLKMEDIEFNRPMVNRIPMPVNVALIVQNIILSTSEDSSESERPVLSSDSEVAKMWGQVEDFCERLLYVLINEIQEKKRSPVAPHIRSAAALLQILVRIELAPPVLRGLSGEQLELIFVDIRLRYSQSLIDYGTAVGILAAQAISEPLTQYMLDSHHRSVSEGTNKNGLIRVREILGVKPVEDERSSEMLLRVDSKIEHNKARVQEIANSIELMSLGRFVVVMKILFEPYGKTRNPDLKSDNIWIEEFETNHPLLRPPDDLTNWCMWFDLNRQTMILKSMSLELIVERLRAQHPNVYIIHSPENSNKVRIRAYIQDKFFKKEQSEEKVEEFRQIFFNTVIRGVKGITNTKVEKINRHKVIEGGAVEIDKDVWGIRTVGTNIYGVILNRFIDPTRTVSTSVGDTLKLFGIDAARQKIMSEIRGFIEKSEVNSRHLMIFADEMTRTGRVTSLERNGLDLREHTNILLRAAAAAPVQVFQDACLNSIVSPVYGISAPLLLGTMPKIGTLYTKVIVNEEFVKNNTKSVDDILDEI